MQETDKKYSGVIIEKPKATDYILGSTSKIAGPGINVLDWSPYLPPSENQASTKADFLECVTMSATHSLEAQLNMLLETNKLTDETINFFKDNKYIVDNKFNISTRFTAKMSGTDILRGNQLNNVAENFRTQGFAPDYLWPMNPNMTWDEYYAPIPQNIKDIAKKALYFIKIQYQWTGQVDVPAIIHTAPIQIATQICPGWDSGFIVKKCSGRPVCHATLIYGVGNTYLNLDHYAPWKQELALDYELPYCMQYISSQATVAFRMGMRGDNILALQNSLKKLGVNIALDSSFGPNTKIAVMQFQKTHGLVPDGIAGPLTIKKIDDLIAVPTNSSKLDLWCQIAKKIEAARPELNNPGNIEFRNQANAILDPKGKRFAKFDTYEIGYNTLKNMFKNACSGVSKIYKPDMNLYEFYNIYAPASDKNTPKLYAESVARYIGVDPLIKIKELI